MVGCFLVHSSVIFESYSPACHKQGKRPHLIYQICMYFCRFVISPYIVHSALYFCIEYVNETMYINPFVMMMRNSYFSSNIFPG